MVIQKIPAGTCIYLTNRKNQKIYIKPGQTLYNDNLYVLYDVRIDGLTIIPKGTRMIGDWVTTAYPPTAQLQITRVFIDKMGQGIDAESDVIDCTTGFNSNEICHVNYLHKKAEFRGDANIDRRIVDLPCRSKVLEDRNLDVAYVEVCMKELSVFVCEDYIQYPCI